jgi:hypothetical protein
MNIVNKIINLAQVLDNLNLYQEADVMTKIAQSVSLVKISNLISPDNLVNQAKELNNTVHETDNSLTRTENNRKPIPGVKADKDDDDNEREASGFINTSKLPYDANQIGQQVRNTAKYLHNTERERSKIAKMINLQGLANDTREQRYRMDATQNTLKNVEEIRSKPLAKNNSEEKTGERDHEEEDKEAISLSALPQKAKDNRDTMVNTLNTVKNTEQIRKNLQ